VGKTFLSEEAAGRARDMIRERFGRKLCHNPTTRPMPRRKQVKPPTNTRDEDPLFQALRQVADEALEKEIPDRLLRVIRAARDSSHSSSERAAPPDPPTSKTGRNR
jgi:hypothetical protein